MSNTIVVPFYFSVCARGDGDTHKTAITFNGALLDRAMLLADALSDRLLFRRGGKFSFLMESHLAANWMMCFEGNLVFIMSPHRANSSLMLLFSFGGMKNEPTGNLMQTESWKLLNDAIYFCGEDDEIYSLVSCLVVFFGLKTWWESNREKVWVICSRTLWFFFKLTAETLRHQNRKTNLRKAKFVFSINQHFPVFPSNPPFPLRSNS